MVEGPLHLVEAGVPVDIWLVLFWDESVGENGSNLLGGPYDLATATAKCQELLDDGLNAGVLGPMKLTFLSAA